jgi:Tfp pilus assembly protein PilO
MSMTDRDKKIVFAIIPLVLLAAFWFLIYSPKKDESVAAQTALETAQADQQTAESQAATVSTAKKGFADDYTTIVRLGKAVPANVDMPSLIVQLDRAARGTHISFDEISTGERQTVSATAAATDTTTSTDAKASSPGKTAQNAQNGVNSANATNQANANTANGTSGTTTPTGTAGSLESIPLTFSFQGTYFDLADFFHRMKRFVKVVNGGDIVVRGRLMTIDSFNFKTATRGYPYLTAQVSSTVYLAPKAEGVSAGATPAGPSSSAPAASSSSSSSSSSSGGSATPAPSTTAPAATVK